MAIGFIAVLLLLPLALVFKEAFAKGVAAFWNAINEPDTLAAVRLSLIAAAIAVPLNTVFGIAAAWAIAKFDFPGKTFLVTLIDLPFSVSPVVSGLIYVLVFGMQGWFGPLAGRSRHPYPVRAAGHRAGDHLRHLSLCGARTDPADGRPGPRRGRSRRHPGRHRSSRPSCASPCPTSNGACCTACCCATPAPWANSARCRWCRAISAASTNTMPLHVELLYNNYDYAGAFAVAALLAMLALLTLALKSLLEWRYADELAAVASPLGEAPCL